MGEKRSEALTLIVIGVVAIGIWGYVKTRPDKPPGKGEARKRPAKPKPARHKMSLARQSGAKSPDVKRALKAFGKLCPSWEGRSDLQKVSVEVETYGPGHYVRKQFGWSRGLYLKLTLPDNARLGEYMGHTIHYRVGPTGVAAVGSKKLGRDWCGMSDCPADGDCLRKAAGFEFLEAEAAPSLPKPTVDCDGVGLALAYLDATGGEPDEDNYAVGKVYADACKEKRWPKRRIRCYLRAETAHQWDKCGFLDE